MLDVERVSHLLVLELYSVSWNNYAMCYLIFKFNNGSMFCRNAQTIIVSWQLNYIPESKSAHIKTRNCNQNHASFRAQYIKSTYI